jgi:hypothetical protein
MRKREGEESEKKGGARRKGGEEEGGANWRGERWDGERKGEERAEKEERKEKSSRVLLPLHVLLAILSPLFINQTSILNWMRLNMGVIQKV